MVISVPPGWSADQAYRPLRAGLSVAAPARTRAARHAASGSALGVDLPGEMIALDLPAGQANDCRAEMTMVAGQAHKHW